MRKTTFALYFGNRGFFPGELIASARQEVVKACEDNGYGYIIMDEALTRYGAVETITEGKLFAKFLEEHKGEYDGIILSLPNFGDENGASVAFKDVDVPILVQAYPDEMDKMDFAHRRDSMCGKMAMCNLLRQMKIKYTLTKKFCVSPLSDDFAEDLRIFAGTCRVVDGMRKFNVGAIGARTTAFKTVRCDEIAFQNRRVNIETIDMTVVFDLMDNADTVKIEAKKRGMITSIDIVTEQSDRAKTIVKAALKYTNICCINESEAEAVTEIEITKDGTVLQDKAFEAIDKIKAFGVSKWIVIHAPRVAFGFDCQTGERFTVSSLNLPKGYIKGSTGAGDAYCSGILYGAHQDESLKNAMELARACAACSLSENNGTDGMRSYAEVLSLAEKYK